MRSVTFAPLSRCGRGAGDEGTSLAHHEVVGRLLALLAIALASSFPTPALRADDEELPHARSVPDVQALPLPREETSFQHLGQELTRYYASADLPRPFWYPIAGPEGRSLTRMGHPHDPFSHSHHNSVWISHANVSGVSFWEDRGRGRIVQQRVLSLDDGPSSAAMLTLNAWIRTGDGATLLVDRRRVEVEPLGDDDWRMVIDLQLEAPGPEPVVLGATPFGMIGVRMAKTIGVQDGGGRILNSAGGRNEPAVFRQPARWVDYSGPVTNESRGGVALFDHPANPDHPTPFHVRDDGWMGASLTMRQAITIEPGKPLRLRYCLWAHDGAPDVAAIDRQWDAFAKLPLPALAPAKDHP